MQSIHSFYDQAQWKYYRIKFQLDESNIMLESVVSVR